MASAKCTLPSRGADAHIPSQSSEASESRQLKIRDFRPYKRLLEGSEPTPMPSLHLQGRWLENAGFPIGAHVRVRVTARGLVVELVECSSVVAELRGRRSRRARADISQG
ncbi:SymE family type I addiction module toxin [Steroidobacter flavus]|uniref:SymE family type I addiction module toxin n=1 Tax=Steroidobacter flavus TaxID=1842136 RepID=A0ABV8T855_9GAMM